jgi:hypothetical protein
MAAIADLTVKKNDGTTNIVFTGVQPSSGDNTPAVWKSQTVGTASAHQPEFRLVGKDTHKGSKRTLRSTFQYPQIATNTTTSITSVVGRALADTNWVIPKGMTATDVNEFVSQYANLLAATLVKQCVQSGYSAS